ESSGRAGLLRLDPAHCPNLLGDIGLDPADALLAGIGKRLQEVLADDLQSGRAAAARFSEHTLAVLLREGDYAATSALAERIRAAFSADVFSIGTRSSVITASIGGVQIGEKIASVSQVLAKASHGVESSSGVGGNRFEIFDPAAMDRAEEEQVRAWVARLRDALENNRFVLHYQPIINLQGDTGSTYETLLRLDPGDGQLISPAAFMQIAEEHDLLGEIDRAVIGQAIAVLGQRIAANRPTTLLVKVSQSALENNDLAAFIGEQLQAHGVPGEYLVLELPEAKVFTNLNATQAFADEIGRFDSRLALEQFGVGLDSFQLLTHLKPNMLKIDRSFIEDLPRNEDNQAKVRDIARRARELGIRTIAEYVQDAASMSILFSSGVDYVEGHFLATASPVMNYDFE